MVSNESTSEVTSQGQVLASFPSDLSVGQDYLSKFEVELQPTEDFRNAMNFLIEQGLASMYNDRVVKRTDNNPDGTITESYIDVDSQTIVFIKHLDDNGNLIYQRSLEYEVEGSVAQLQRELYEFSKISPDSNLPFTAMKIYSHPKIN